MSESKKKLAKSKVLATIILLVLFVFLVIGIFLLINFNRKKALEKDKDNFPQETKVSENGATGLLGDFPVYPNATLESSYSTEGDKKATSVVWETNATLTEVSTFYKEVLEKAGWQISSNIENENSSTFSFAKGESFGFIGIGEGEGGLTIISVTIGLRNL